MTVDVGSLKMLFLAIVGSLLSLSVTASGQMSGGALPTRWDKDVSPTSPLPEYPRPQMTRPKWQSLNGSWDCALSDSGATAPPASFDEKILVPFPYESALSGIGKPSPTTQRLWYRRTFTVSADWLTSGQHVLLHFGAVNWDSTVSVNETSLGEHKGGYEAFDYDITSALKPGENTLTVSAFNPMVVDSPDAQVLGKQRLHHDGIFYTGATGIWQSVWIEPVPATYVTSLKLVSDIDAKILHVTVDTAGPADAVTVTAIDGGKSVASVTGKAGNELALSVTDPHLWTPQDPHLYDLHIAIAGSPDAVDSYFAMRKISLGKDSQGRTCIMLNNSIIFEVGALDQGYWPDGIYTAPTDEALKSDILAAKGFGFNLLRKHAKVEPDRWYYWTDKLGMLVWQDMPQCFGQSHRGGDDVLNDDAKAQWLSEWKAILAQHMNHPSIVVWTTFNEGWGQHDTADIVALTKQIDSSRLVNDASGWTDKGVGDIRDTHAYPGPWCEKPEESRAVVNGEFGGVTMRVTGHMWTKKVMGYGKTLTDGWTVTQKYQDLLKTAYRLRDDRGCSAVVYTQLTDVEQESNGLLTYDREITKPIGAMITAANKGQFPPLPPPPPPVMSHDLVPTSEDQPQTWSYTTEAPADNWMKPDFDSSSWKTGAAPFGQGYDHNTEWNNTPGDIWIRRTITLPAELPPKLVVRTIHDEDVDVYLDGVPAASAKGYTGEYVNLPLSPDARAAMKAGKNVIAAHCHQTVGGQVIDVGIVAAQ
jgi:hypothetical protein